MQKLAFILLTLILSNYTWISIGVAQESNILWSSLSSSTHQIDQEGETLLISHLNQSIIGSARGEDSMILSGFTSGLQWPAVVSFTLFDADKDEPIPGFDPIPDGAFLNLEQLPTSLNICANTLGPVESVQFSLNRNQYFRYEHYSPYTLFGDVEGDFAGRRISIGNYTLSASPYSKGKTREPIGQRSEISFTVLRADTTVGITQFVLVDAGRNTDLFPLENEVMLDLDALPEQLNVRAEVFGQVKSVEFEIQPTGHERIEQVSPFTLFGDLEEDYLSGMFGADSIRITATAYQMQKARGMGSIPKSIDLVIDNSTVITKQSGHDTDALSRLNYAIIPADFVLDAAYPNPFSETTTIRFGLPEASFVKLIVYNALGQVVTTLTSAQLEPGMHEMPFSAGALPSGTYFYRLESATKVLTKSMLLVR